MNPNVELDRLLEAWVETQRPSSIQRATLREAIMGYEPVSAPDVLNPRWWSDFARSMMENAMAPARLACNYATWAEVL